MSKPIDLSFRDGSLILDGLQPEAVKLDFFDVKFDDRTQQFRAPADAYRDLILFFKQKQILIEDTARQYEVVDLSLKKEILPRVHQKEAIEAWAHAGYKGVISLPTGAGKSIIAVLAMLKVQRSTLVVVPTIDLLEQWHQLLTSFFDIPIGRLGGGHKDYQSVSVATYDTARLIVETKGHLFGFLVFDECHHLPAECYQIIAKASIAPYRMGLSATVERSDGGEEILYGLVGNKVYEGRIDEMTTQVLSPYDVVEVAIALTEDERAYYERHRNVYLGFLRQQGINMGRPDGWQQFILRAGRNEAGKLAMKSYRKQKQVAQNASQKFEKIWELLNNHSNESTIIFTDNNLLAYSIGRKFILPVLTHKTKPSERKRILDEFRSGLLKVIVTSKVLNEGVDVPEASVAMVVSGSGAVREHVQRLGRILRHAPGKHAVLYEFVTQDSNEQFVNERRRKHHAYQKFS